MCRHVPSARAVPLPSPAHLCSLPHLKIGRSFSQANPRKVAGVGSNPAPPFALKLGEGCCRFPLLSRKLVPMVEPIAPACPQGQCPLASLAIHPCPHLQGPMGDATQHPPAWHPPTQHPPAWLSPAPALAMDLWQGGKGSASPVLSPVSGCGVWCRGSSATRPALAGSQARQGQCSRCAWLCLQRWFASRKAWHPRQPLACQPAVSLPGPAPRGCRALDPKAPSSCLGCKCSRAGLCMFFWRGSVSFSPWGGWRDGGAGPGVAVPASRGAVPSPCITPQVRSPMGQGSWHWLWGPNVALCAVGVPTFGHCRHNSPSHNPAPTCTPLAPRGPSPHNLQVPDSPVSTLRLCRGALEVPAQPVKGQRDVAGFRHLSEWGSSFPSVLPAALLRAQVLSAALSVCVEGKGSLFCSQ